MNVPFTMPNEALDKPFLEGAKAAGLVALAGHRSVGGMARQHLQRHADGGVEALVSFMEHFQQKHG